MTQARFAAFSLSITDGIGLIAIGSSGAMDLVVAESMKKGVLAQSVPLKDPADEDSNFSASKAGDHVVMIGPVAGSWDVYGPFAKLDDAEAFADSNSEDTDYNVASIERT